MERNTNLYSNGDIDNINYNMLPKHYINYILRICPQYAKYSNWSKLNGLYWYLLLELQLQFAEHCDWYKLSNANWNGLLAYHPHFEKYRK